MSDLEQIAQSVKRSGLVNIVLWLIMLVTIITCIFWVMFGGPVTEAETRARAVEKLWVIVGPVVVGLVAKSKITGDQKTAVAQASAPLVVDSQDTRE